ncbi:MalM family protein [Ramlibacter sp. MMS24-I3-19]|uniref:MalM family protein n=1 Tax=Ramlibacter sp. MMS24-I3-19 TaxID=3416606 RepID=UPI003D094EE9
MGQIERIVMRVAALAVCTAMMVGCGTPIQAAMGTYQDAKPCCADVRGLPYSPLAVGQTVKFKLDGASPAFVFTGGKSFFQAFALPSTEADYGLALSSYLDKYWHASGDETHILYPVLTLMDADYRTVKVISTDLMRYEPPTWGEPVRLVGRLRITPKAGVRFVVIHTTTDILQQQTTFSLPGSTGVAMVGKTPIPITSAGSVRTYPHAPIGDLKLEVVDLSGHP